MRQLLEDLLSVSDVEVTAVSTDADAMRALKASDAQFQVIVCPAPPVGAKHSLVQKVRNTPQTKDIPVVCLSPERELQSRAMAFKSGATEYVNLPVSPASLAEHVHKWAWRDHRPF